jgi:hypothetical protein
MNAGALLRVRMKPDDPAIALWREPEEWTTNNPLGYVCGGDMLVYTGEARRVDSTTFVRVLSYRGVGWVVRDTVEIAVSTYRSV